MKKYFVLLSCMIFSFALLRCGKDDSSIINTPIDDNDDTIEPKSVYLVSPPEGKLPYPIHDPAFTQEQYNKMMDELFLINDFGEVQGATNKEQMYIHDGIDIVAPNGTKIFAVDSGYVRAIIGSAPYYMAVFIEDKNNPGFVWSYVHIYDFKVKVGDFVKQGQELAVISFKGVEHIHFGRAKINTASNLQSFDGYFYIRPDDYFEYIDSEAPIFYNIIKYFNNDTGAIISEKTDGKIKLSGKVDIVAGIRDGGKYAHAKRTDFVLNYGDRLAVDKIQYEITDLNGNTQHFDSFDFSKLMFKYSYTENWIKTNIIYKDYPSVQYTPPSNYDKFFSFYIITNGYSQNDYYEVDLTDDSRCWNTTEKNQDGTPKYINGIYEIKITATDYKGNSSTKIDSVVVEN